MVEAVVIYICPECERWQRYEGTCESLCGVKTVGVEMVPKKGRQESPPPPDSHGGSE